MRQPDDHAEAEACAPRRRHWSLDETKLPLVAIVVVAYNSASHLERLIHSLGRLDYPADKRRLVLVDNASLDNSVEVAETAAANTNLALQVIRMQRNAGFGAGMNAGVRACDEEVVFLLNPDIELDRECLRELVEAADALPGAALVEARQLPYEHPKLYNPVTLETGWVSAAACLVRRDAFRAAGGFDEALFLYCEDVDLSWRIRAGGGRCYYAPRAVVHHYTYGDITLEKPLQAYYTRLHGLFLRWRYGSWKMIAKGYLHLLAYWLRVRADPARRRQVWAILWQHLKLLPAALRGRRVLRHAGVESFHAWDYAFSRPGAAYACRRPAFTPLVTVVIRTHRRPAMLREALWSVARQTYPAVEAVVAEDGSTDGQAVVAEFADRLPIRYVGLPIGSGKERTGNAGVADGRGKYVMFLDDDDVLFADHIETLVAALQGERTRVAYAVGLEAVQHIHSQDPLQYDIRARQAIWQQPFDRLRLLQHNFIPIQCVLFERQLFDAVGGLDESLNGYLEDWDLWLRFALRGERFAYVPKGTSEYRRRVVTAADHAQDCERQRLLDAARQVVLAKHRSCQVSLTLEDVGRLMDRVQRLESSTPKELLRGVRRRGLGRSLLKGIWQLCQSR